MKTRNLIVTGAVAAYFLLAALGKLAEADAKFVAVSSQQYAESVCIWQSQVAMGTPKVAADGHPDYENRGIDCK